MKDPIKSIQRVYIKTLEISNGRGYSLYLHYSDNAGQRVRHSLHLRVLSPLGMQTATDYEKQLSRENWELAELLRSQTEQALIQGTHRQATRHGSRELFLPYFDRVTEQKLNPRTREQYELVRKRLVAYAGEYITFKDIDRFFVMDFVDFLLHKAPERATGQKYLSPNTVGVTLSRLQAVLRRAVQDNLIIYDPSQGIKKPSTPSGREYLTEEELERLEAYAESTTKRAHIKSLTPFLFSCYTGLRLSDVIALQWSNIEQLERAGQKVYILKYQQQKTKKQCILPLTDKALKLLNTSPKLAKATNRVFAYMPHNNTINKVLKTIAQAIGITKNLHFHIGRHTFAVLSLNKGVDIYSVSNLLGHSDIKVTQIYAKMTDEKLYKALDILNQ